MSKMWGATCGINNECWGGDPTQWCEAFPGGCNCGDVGDLGIADIPRDKLQETLDASTTKFVLDKDDKLLEVGLLKEAGLKVGDRLLSISEMTCSIPEHWYRNSMLGDRESILTWQFVASKLEIRFSRNGTIMKGEMANPAL